MKLLAYVSSALLLLSLVVTAAVTEKDFKVIDYSIEMKEGGKQPLFSGEKRVIVKATLLKGDELGVHTETIPFMVHVISGQGELVLGENEKSVVLKKGTIVTVESNIAHNVIATSELSFLVIKFVGDK